MTVVSAQLEKPDFMIIGAAKSGTTSLYGYLTRHPRVRMSYPKEPEFFSREDHFAKGVGWYASLFAGASGGDVLGEASTTYTRWPHTLDAPALIAEHTTTRRFVYLIRNPIDRAYSHYRHHMREGVTKTFEQALGDDSIYLDCGDYMMQIERYLRFFDAGSICVITLDDLKTKTAEALGTVQAFLGLDAADLTAGGEERRNAGDDDHYLRHRTAERLKRVPLVGRGASLLPSGLRRSLFERFRKTGIATKIRAEGAAPSMRPETRKRLAEHYREPMERLSDHLGRDLTPWLRDEAPV